MKVPEAIELLKNRPIIASILKRLDNELPNTLFYHTAEHTHDVFHEVILFASTAELSLKEMELLALGAAYHDAGFLTRTDNNEGLGADMARQAMRDSKSYSAGEIELVHAMIEDTQLKPTVHGMKQVARTTLAGYLLDADVSNLGREDFFDKVELVRREVGMADKQEFYKRALQLITAHQWYTEAAKGLRQTQKEENIKLLKARVAGV